MAIRRPQRISVGCVMAKVCSENLIRPRELPLSPQMLRDSEKKLNLPWYSLEHLSSEQCLLRNPASCKAVPESDMDCSQGPVGTWGVFRLPGMWLLVQASFQLAAPVILGPGPEGPPCRMNRGQDQSPSSLPGFDTRRWQWHWQ